MSVLSGLGEPDRPNVASTIFRTVQDLTGSRHDVESTYAPNVVWIDNSQDRPETELQEAKPFVFGANKP